MLIGVSGYIGSGKDTVAKMIQETVIRDIFAKKYQGDKAHDEAYIAQLVNEGREHISGWKVKKFAGKLKEICSLLTGIPVSQFELQSVKDSLLGPEWDYITYLVGNQVFYKTSNQKAIPKNNRMTVRELLQKMGTDAMRDKVHPNIHINALFAEYKVPSNYWSEVRMNNTWAPPFCANCKKSTNDMTRYICDECLSSDQGKPNWIISDCRFPNEAKAIKDKGGIVIRVNRKYVEYPLPSGGTAKVIDYIPGFDKPKHASETALDNWKFDWVLENDDTLEELLGQVAVMLKENNLL